MAREKSSLQPEPKDPRTVKHGCASCKHKDVPLSSFPCKDCGMSKGLWLYWEDIQKREAFD